MGRNDASSPPLRIENEQYLIEIASANGAISRIYDKTGGLELITEPALADNFRVCMALREFRAAYIIGKDQRLTDVEQGDTAVTLTWDGPLKDLQDQQFDGLSVTMNVELVDERVEFRLDVHNGTPHRMYEVWYPIIGGMTGMGERKDTKTYIPGPDGRDSDQQIFWDFQPRWGLQAAMRYPEIIFKHPEHMGTLWMDIYNPQLGRGVYFGHKDDSPLWKVFRTELQPGIGYLRDPGSNWPRPEEVDPRFPVGLNIEWMCLLADLDPGETFRGAPVVLQSHDGDWKEAAAIHRSLGGPAGQPNRQPPPPAAAKTVCEGVSEVKQDDIRLENELYLVEVDQTTGVIRRIYDRTGDVELITEPRIADSFQLLTQTADMHQDWISGKDQSLSSYEQTEGRLLLSWDGPLIGKSDAPYEISVEMEIVFVESQIEFRLNLDNRTPRTISEVWYPIVGGISGIGERTDTRSTLRTGDNVFDWYLASPIDPTEEDRTSELKLIYSYNEPNVSQVRQTGAPWVDIYNVNTRRALYFSAHDVVVRNQARRFEKRPGITAAGEDDLSSPTGYMHCVYYPYVRPNEAFAGPPVVFRFHDGDWHEGARLYREWFTSNLEVRDPRKDWMRQEMAYQASMFLLPEGEQVHWRFSDIPGWAKAAKNHGVNAVQIIGWCDGGAYGDQPSYKPDPRLGTWDGLAEAIRECHDMGVKVIFFVNTYPICVDLDWYDEELYRYRAIDEHGEWYRDESVGLGTVYGRLVTAARVVPWKKGLTRLTVNGSLGVPEFRRLLVKQFRKLAEIGADGLHIDQCTGWGFDINPLAELPPDQAIAEGQLRCLEETLDACREVNADFSISLESHQWDRPLKYANVAWDWMPSYARDYYVTKVTKYTFPEWVGTCTVFQPYDYNVVNNAVRFGSFLHIALANWTSYMGDPLFEPLSDYIAEIQRMREELRETIYMGEYLDDLQAEVRVSNDMRYAVHRNTGSGKRAVVAVNFNAEPQNLTVSSFDGNEGGQVYIYEPFKDRVEGKLPLSVPVPGERLAIVVEK